MPFNPPPRQRARRFPASALAACVLTAIAVVQTTATEQANSAPPAPSDVQPNASRVTANVLARKVWPPGSLENVRPLIPRDKTFYSIEIKLVSSEPATPRANNLAEPGRTLEAFSERMIPEGIVGRSITAVLTLAGATDGVRWMIDKIEFTR